MWIGLTITIHSMHTVGFLEFLHKDIKSFGPFNVALWAWESIFRFDGIRPLIPIFSKGGVVKGSKWWNKQKSHHRHLRNNLFASPRAPARIAYYTYPTLSKGLRRDGMCSNRKSVFFLRLGGSQQSTLRTCIISFQKYNQGQHSFPSNLSFLWINWEGKKHILIWPSTFLLIVFV